MRTTVTLDDDLMAKARSYTGLKETSAVIRAALTALVERDQLGGKGFGGGELHEFPAAGFFRFRNLAAV